MSDQAKTTKAQFAWASIAGADPEPVEVIERDGRKGVLTVGCPDPFWLDDDAAAVRLNLTDLQRPASLYTFEDRIAKQKAYDLKYGEGAFRRAHSWRGSR